MPRISRVVVPGIPHHVIQRGNRRQPTFFGAWDYSLYRQLLIATCGRYGVSVWAYCCMPNHVHFIAVPTDAQSLAKAFGRAHRAYSTIINRREGWTGYLWQGRFASYPMDERHLLAATRYVLSNPVRSGLVTSAPDWPHSSLAAHRAGVADELVETAPLARRVRDWEGLLGASLPWNESHRIDRHTSSGLPLGSDAFVSELESRTGRSLRPPIASLPR